jgi:hypothetical protein
MKRLLKDLIRGGFLKAVIFICLCAILAPAISFAGGMPQTQYRFPIGNTTNSSSGDFVSATSRYSGLGSYYSYYIEVPPGTQNLTVEIYDANVYNSSNNNIDENLGSSWNTTVAYSLLNPSAAQVSAATCGNQANGYCNSGTCTSGVGNELCSVNTNNYWRALYNVTSASGIAAGHWEFRMQMNSGSNVNAFAVRARDTSTSKELNMYAQPFDIPGADGSTGTVESANLYPYVTSGCSLKSNSWDYDYDGTNGGGTIAFTSRLGFTSSSSETGGNGVWTTDNISGWTSDTAAYDYGIWSALISVNVHNGVSNIVTYYLGRDTSVGASTTRPASKPADTSTFRLYLPTSSATDAPVKPYVTQELQHVSGPNPVEAGETTTLQVVITVNNPTAYPITFTASKLVSAYVPGSVTGGQVVYAGHSAPNSMVVSEPSSGGTGWITWNPGTVAAGATVQLSYYIDVTPDAGWTGSSIAVTGTSLNGYGTTAVFVDETGNTTQSRATYTFGPLCELLAGSTINTLATLSSFDAYVADGRVVVEWSTSSEYNTMGFFLKRLDSGSGRYVTVGDRIVPAVFEGNRAGVYRVVDAGASAGAQTTYMLVEKEARGNTRSYGPFVVTPGSRSVFAAAASLSGRKSVQVASVKGSSTSDTVAKKSVKSAAVITTGDKIRVAVNSDGIYSINAATIAKYLGVRASEAANYIRNRQLAITNNGSSVAYLADTANSRILFYGQAIKSNYTTENVYWITKGRGSVMGSVGSAATPEASTDTFSFFKSFEEKHIDASFTATDPDSNYWYWDYIYTDDPDYVTRSFSLTVSGANTAASASLAVKLLGQASSSQAQFTLNGQSIGSGSVGVESKTISLSIPAGLLVNGTNTLEITGASGSMFFIESFGLTYERYYTADGNSLEFSAGNAAVTVNGFSESGIYVFDISTPSSPKKVNVTIANKSAGFTPSASSGQYIAVSEGAIKSVTGINGYKTPSNFKSKTGATYVVITSDELKSAANILANFRKGFGHKTMVVTVAEIMNEYNYGIYSPAAVKKFLTYASKNWSNKPQYVALAGGGTYDYNDYLGYGGQQVPPAMVASPDGLVASDNYYADVDGDHIPDMAIGRLPAYDSSELTGIVGKIISYERGSGTGLTGKALLVADIPDGGGDFNGDIDSVGALISSNATVSKLYHSDYTDPAEMNTKLLSSVNSGAALMSYFGHAGIDRLSMDGVLTNADAAAMTNISRLPVMTAMTCLMGHFAWPGMTSLAETLLQNKNGGAAAVFTATGLSDDKQALLIDKAFFSAAYGGSAITVGDIVIAAMKKANLNNDYKYMLDMYIIFGDPALKVKGLKKTSVTDRIKNRISGILNSRQP